MLLRLCLSLAAQVCLNAGKYHPRVGDVDFNDFAALELFALTQNVLDGYCFADNFCVDYVFEFDFAV
jgi:hypothetical protein